GCFGPQANWIICPLLNPTGMARATRENAAGIDLNRDYRQPVTPEVRAHTGWLQRQPRFHAAICLHEDDEATGFYLYELNPDRRPSVAGVALAAVAPLCPIEQAAVIDGRETDAPGIIRPITDPLLRDQWPEAIYLRHHHTTLSYTFETPTTRPLEQRTATQAAAIRAALEILTRATTG
ncbi:MAG: succinylglutamate desuccinylase, partial [Candidatus Didemnitutus sp.]|nr:succinylglutamate desuccinylase [Candidatus Didemnitutus sp.]